MDDDGMIFQISRCTVCWGTADKKGQFTFNSPVLILVYVGVIYYLPLQMERQFEAQGIFTVSQVFAHKLKSNYKIHLKMLQESIQIVDCEAQLSFNYHTVEIRCISVPLHLYRLIKVILYLPAF